VLRDIVGFHQDEAGDWVAELSCLHSQHLRHRPPFQDRPWVLDPAQRAASVGTYIECPLCDRAEMPEGLRLLGTAGRWDQDSLPGVFRRLHRTPEAVWGLLRVTEGNIGIRMETSPRLDRPLEAGARQPIPPRVPHMLAVAGPVQLVLELWGS
jgi:tellurite methyltransferase